MLDTESLLVGAVTRPDGSRDLSRAAVLSGPNTEVAGEKAKEKFFLVIPRDAQPGTARRVWYQLRNARMVQEDLTAINRIELKQSIILHIENMMKKKLREKIDASGSITDRVRNEILYANALKQKAELSTQIYEWEDKIDQDPNAVAYIGASLYPISLLLPVSRELSMQLLRESENYKVEELLLPKGWTYLIHGSNLDRTHWRGEERKQLDGDTFEVRGLGLSTLDRSDIEEREKNNQSLRASGVRVGSYDTTTNYSQGKGIHLEIRVVFPAFNSRHPLSKEHKAALIQKYGEDKVLALFELSDSVHWKNHQGGRHPLLPGGMKLVKLTDQTLEGKGRVVQYIPETLIDIYQQETSRILEWQD